MSNRVEKEVSKLPLHFIINLLLSTVWKYDDDNNNNVKKQ